MSDFEKTETGLGEECGVFGAYDLDGRDVASSIYYGLFALQHRGQESCGIAVTDTRGRRRVLSRKGLGHVDDVFKEDTLAELKGNLGVGHVRYSTAGGTRVENAQPLVINYVKGTLAIAHNGNLRRLPEMKPQGLYLVRDGVSMLNLSSNDYLGLADDVALKSEFLQTLDPQTCRFSSTSSRLLTGNYPAYTRLEKRLAQLYGAESALVFADGMTLYLTHGHVRTPDDHPEGIRHNNYEQLERLVAENADQYERIFIVTESIFSMDGDESDLPRLVTLKRQYPQVYLYLDEAHAFGVRGELGLGCAEEQGVVGDIDFLVGTFGKAAASMGAFVICSETMKQYLVNTMRPLIFTTALPPVNLEWTLFIVNKICNMQKRREHLAQIGRRVREALNPLNGGIVSSSHIIPYVLGESERAVEVALRLQHEGFYLLPVRPPTVPRGTSRLRISLNAECSDSDIDRLITTLQHIQSSL